MKTVSKTALDEVIRLTRKFYKTGDTDLLAAKHANCDAVSRGICGNDGMWLQISDLVTGILGGHTAVKPNATNQDIYDVFALLGYEVTADAEPVEA